MLRKKTYRDLNPDKEYQKLLCYHYTISLKVEGERFELSVAFSKLEQRLISSQVH